MSTSPDLEKFLATAEPADLGPGPRQGVQSQAALEKQLTPLLRGSRLSAERQELIQALILLWHDHLDAAHTVAQSVENSDGAFVHGIMHRREPDYGNAAYWFRRVGKHPAFAEIAKQAAALLQPKDEALRNELIPAGQWDPFAFISACEQANRNPSATTRKTALQDLQQIETSVLLARFTGT